MKKFLILSVLAALVLTVHAGALEYTMEAPDGPNYGKATSIEVVHTRDNGERKTPTSVKTPPSSRPALERPRRTCPAAASTSPLIWPRRPRPGPGL